MFFFSVPPGDVFGSFPKDKNTKIWYLSSQDILNNKKFHSVHLPYQAKLKTVKFVITPL